MWDELCSKACLGDVLISSHCVEKKHTTTSGQMQFFQCNENELTRRQAKFCFDHSSVSYMSDNILNVAE